MKNKNEYKKNNNIIKCACLLLIFTYFVIMTVAKYTSSTFGNNVVGVARFVVNSDLSEAIQTFELTNLYPGCEDKIIYFTVSNNLGDSVSEVAVGYSFTIKSLGNLPLTYNVEVDSDNTSNNGTTANQIRNGSEIIWTGGRFPVSTKTTHTYKVTVAWDETKNASNYSEEIDMVTIAVSSEQIN